MTTNTLTNKKLSQSFAEVLSSLSEREQVVLQRRVWVDWEKETLQSIGNSFSPAITRERVRQIEDSWIKKIWKVVTRSDLISIQQIAHKYLNLHWGIISKEKLVNILIKDLELESNINTWIIDIIIQADKSITKSKQKFGCKIYYTLENVNKKDVDLIHKEALKVLKKKKTVMKKTALYETVIGNLNAKQKFSLSFIDTVLDFFDDIVFWEENLIWLEKWKILNPKTLKDKAIYVLKKEKVPMHFVDVTNKVTDMIGKPVKVNTIHNELIRNEEFVLIGRWIYALKEWWFVPGTVLDVIVEILKKNWEPMNTEDITKEVLKIRNVKHSTIYMNLQNKKVIERVWRNYYELKKD